MAYEHIPVLLKEVIEYLDVSPGKNFVDATLGGGGYTSAIIAKNRPDGKVLAIDLDQDAIDESAKGIGLRAKNLILHHGNFAHVDKIVEHYKFSNINGIVADLGLSSYELEHRGMSFQTDQPLDMRFNQSGEHIDAKFVLNNYNEHQLYKIFTEFGEEKFSKQIVNKILGLRAKGVALSNTTDLYQVIVDALPKPVKHRADDSARRIFQDLRIEVNHELENLKEFLPKAFDVLSPGGRLVIVSFHSLEDRIVKQFFNQLSKGCVCPLDFPQCVCGKNPQGKILTKKVLLASAEELHTNPRAKPAKLRAIQKI